MLASSGSHNPFSIRFGQRYHPRQSYSPSLRVFSKQMINHSSCVGALGSCTAAIASLIWVMVVLNGTDEENLLRMTDCMLSSLLMIPFSFGYVPSTYLKALCTRRAISTSLDHDSHVPSFNFSILDGNLITILARVGAHNLLKLYLHKSLFSDVVVKRLYITCIWVGVDLLPLFSDVVVKWLRKEVVVSESTCTPSM
ncbi:hypothetical protein K439DRAFT_1616269 [Ramaria rubella]|nr:hypothetical protein K439DRAFT_1616269 [Ramaria rubella]